MQVSSGGEDSPITAMNVTPLVDVALVLVIIFMITMPALLEKSLQVQASSLPSVTIAPVSAPILVEVSVDAVSVDGTRVSLSALSSELKRLVWARRLKSPSVAILAAPAVEHGRVIAVLDSALKADITDLNIIDPLEAGDGDL